MMLGRQQLKPFHLERWDLAHRATNYSRWATAEAYYDIEYEHVSSGGRPTGLRVGERKKRTSLLTATLTKSAYFIARSMLLHALMR